jgi:hypothetical protein
VARFDEALTEAGDIMAEFAVEMNLEALQLSRNLRSGNAVYCRLILGV